MEDSQDIGKQATGQMGDMGKKVGGKLARKAVGKAAKALKKLLASFLKKAIVGILKALLIKGVPIIAIIAITILLILCVLESIPGADWFLGGNTRTEEQIAADTEYQKEYKELADGSVAEIYGYRADEKWRNKFAISVKPTWGIPSALAKYQIVKANEKIELPDPDEMFNDLKPVFHYKTITDDVERWKTVTTHCSPSGCRTSTSYSTQKRPAHKVIDWIWTAYGDVKVPSLKKYWRSPQLIGRTIIDPETDRRIKGPETEEDWKNNNGSIDSKYLHLWTHCSESGDGSSSTCTSKYYQFENTEADDRGVPLVEFDSSRLKTLLMGKGVLEKDIPTIYEFISAADDFYAPQFDGSIGHSTYSNANFEFTGIVSDGWVWPVANNRTVTSTFGGRWGTFHYGIDLGGRAANGLPILAAKDGVVILAQWSDSYGNWVIIAHDDGLETRYAHMSRLTVRSGQQLKAGDQVGLLGTTGHSTGPHLHFEVLRPGSASPFARSSQMEEAYDPMVFLGRVLREEGS